MKANHSANGLKYELLIIDDDNVSQQLLSDMLHKTGYSVRTANSGKLALKQINIKKPSLILLNAMMPEMDSFEICRRLKADKNSCNIPIIFIGAQDDEKSKTAGFQAGGVDYIPKPFKKEEIIARIGVHINVLQLQFELELKNKNLEEEITKRTQREKELRESEDMFRKLAMSTPIAICIYQDNQWIYTNPAGEQLSGYKLEEYGKMGFWEFVAPEYQPIIKDRAKERLAGINNNEGFEFRIIRKDGEPRWVYLKGALITYKGKPAGLISVIDITENKQMENQLRQNEEFYRNMFEKNMAVMLLVDPTDSSIIDANEAASNFYGWGHDPLVQMKISQINTLSHREVMEAVKKAISLQRNFFQFKHHTANGTIKDVEVYTSKIIRNGKDMLFSIIHDISERKKAEKELLEANQKMDVFFNQSLDGFFFVMLDKPIAWNDGANKEKLLKYALTHLRMARVNDALLSQYGATREQFIGLTPAKLFAHNIEEGKRILRALFDRGNLHCETDERKISGETVIIEGDYSCLYDPEGRIIGHFGIQRDVTEQKKAGETIQKLTKGIEQSLSSVIITNTDGVIEYANPRFYKATSLVASEVIGKNIQELKAGKIQERQYEKMWRTLSSGEIWQGELLTRGKNGELFWEWATVTPIKNENGQATNYIFIKEDISLRKQMETDLIMARQKAEESDCLKSAFLANMSHEIRTPLNSIIGFSELLIDPSFDKKKKKEFIGHIVSSGNNLLNIINDIIDISKIESGEITVRKVSIHAENFVSEIRSRFEIKIKEKGLGFLLNLPENEKPIFILADPDRLTQVFSNLITNALKFTEKGNIQIGYEVFDSNVQFYVKDTGIGIPEEYHSSVFERFRQVESSYRRRYGGNGLGLAITKNLIEIMGGKIWLASETGKGSAFYFTIPSGKHPETQSTSDHNQTDSQRG